MASEIVTTHKYTRKSYPTIKNHSCVTDEFEYIIKEYYQTLPGSFRKVKFDIYQNSVGKFVGHIAYYDRTDYRIPLYSTPECDTEDEARENYNNFLNNFYNKKEL